MNTRNWSDGSRITFQNLTNCGGGSQVFGAYYCLSGFATISNPMGTKVCEANVSYYYDTTYKYITANCRYK